MEVELFNTVRVDNGCPQDDLTLKSRFKWTQQKIEDETQIGGVIHIKSIKSLRPTILRHYDAPIIRGPTTLLSKKVNNAPTNTDANAELKKLFQISPFDYSKPSKLIQYLIRTITYRNKSGWTLDFFAGSGATAQAVINQNMEDGGERKYILMEREKYLHRVAIPRIMKSLYSSQWKDGKPLKKEGISHIYQKNSVESFSDALRNIAPANIQTGTRLGYLIDPKDENSHLRLNISTFSTPYSYTMEYEIDGVLSQTNVDLVETFNFLLGIRDIRRRYVEHQNRWYSVIFGTLQGESILIIWRPTGRLDLDLESDFLSREILQGLPAPPLKIYHNCAKLRLKGTELSPIEPEFIGKMFN